MSKFLFKASENRLKVNVHVHGNEIDSEALRRNHNSWFYCSGAMILQLSFYTNLAVLLENILKNHIMVNIENTTAVKTARVVSLSQNQAAEFPTYRKVLWLVRGFFKILNF